ncbi:twin-arginine translocation pathway signal protein [Hoeflea sp. AS60]|uniref:Acg family FMN-binding oxidoreductase n=1 Tax=Hoeflea sp. AS60 TaxID=3135780 RepID=UPI003170E4C1
MSLSRRKMLSIIGGGTIVAAAGGAGAFLTTRTPKKALAPWSAAGTYSDPRRNALSHALLAPNPHNRQPWLVDLDTPEVIDLYRDKSKDLPHTDPFSRQLTIGMGCFIELMVMAAAQTGHAVELALFPDGEDGPVARAHLVESGAEPDPLFAAVQHRRSCKEPFEARPVTPEHAALLEPFADLITAPEKVSELIELTWSAWKVEVETPRTYKESVDLMRIGKAEINAQPDGIDLGGPFLSSLALLGQLSREGQLDQTSSQYTQGVAVYEEMLHATPAYAALTSASNQRTDQIEAGRRWLRLNLAATTHGLALHPVSQCLQEYPEMRHHYDRAHELLAPEGHTVQMLGRLGYGPTTPHSPRWPLEAKIIDT